MVAGTSPRVLILDDDVALVEALSLVLEDHGYAVESKLTRTISDVEGATPDLVIIDAPPGCRGATLNFVQRLRLNEKTASVPILITTASVGNIDTATLRERRIHVLSKPFDIPELLASVAKLLGRSWANRISLP